MANEGDSVDSAAILEKVAAILAAMAARQWLHDAAFERRMAELKSLRETIAADGERIKELVRVVERRCRHLGLA